MLTSVRRHLTENPLVLSGAVTTSYFLFYTAYDKTKKTLVISNLHDLVAARRGIDWSLVELNKAISLSGLTIMLTSFLPQFTKRSKDLLWISMNMLWAHSIYSMYKFYQFDIRKVFADKWMKRLSVFLGIAGQAALSLGYWGFVDYTTLLVSATTLSIAHFWTMEVDFKYQLQVRPYAYLPFPLAAWSLYNYFAKK